MLGGLLENGLDERYDSARDWRATNRWNKARLAWFAVHPEAKRPVKSALLEEGGRDRRRSASG